MPDQPTFDISARGIGAAESTTTTGAPDWSELLLEVDCEKPWRAQGATGSMFLTREAAHQIIEALRGSLGPSGGMTIIELIWGQLDAVMDRLMADIALGGPGGFEDHDKGEALGLATAIAILRRPDAYDVDAVREEALVRWEARSER